MNAKVKPEAAPVQGRKRLAYWTLDRVTQRHRDLAGVLGAKGYDVRFFTSTHALATEIRNRRAAIILVDDAGSRAQVDNVLNMVANMPELQGVRMVLTTSGVHPHARQIAAWHSFRDIISLDLDDSQFVRRFLFSTSGKSSSLPLPLPHLATNQICAVNLPARIVWVSPTRIRIECRMTPTPGAILTLSGALPDNLGLPSLAIKVEEVHKSFLLYRFSDAIVGSWVTPPAGQEKVAQVLDFLKAKDPGQRRRVFVAAQTNSFRTDVLNLVKGPYFEVKAALQKQSIVDEPKFFNPDVVIIEDSLCREEGFDRLKTMLQGVSNEITVIVKGTRFTRETLLRSVGHHQLIVVQQLPQTLAETILKRYASGNHRHITMSDPDAIHILPDDSNSYGNLRVPARLTRVHPVGIQVALPFPVGNFALCRIESPIMTRALGRSPWAKVTNTHVTLSADTNANPYSCQIDCHLADVSREDRRLLASSLASYMTEQLALSINPPSATEGDAERTIDGKVVALPNSADAQRTLSTPIERPSLDPKKKKKKDSWKSALVGLKYASIFFGVSALCALLFWLIIQVASEDHQKSGGEYTNSLRRMSPTKFKEDNDAH